jgi:hypothetical protein
MKTQSFINPNSKLRLVGVKLSSNTEAKVEKDSDGINGKINVGVDGRKYYLAEFEDPENFMAATRMRVVSQSGSEGAASWRLPSPKKMLANVGRDLPGAIITRFVEPYEVNGRMVDTYSTIVFGGEIIENVFQKAGHIIIGTTPDPTIVKDEIFQEAGGLS